MFYEVVPEGKVEALTYHFDASLLPGQIVIVPLGKRRVPGIVIKKVAQPDFGTKKILQVLYSTPLPTYLIKIMQFMHDYYLVPYGTAASLVLPNGVEKKRRKTEQMFGNITLETGPDKTFRSGPRPAGPSPRAAGANSRAAALRNAPSLKCSRHPSLPTKTEQSSFSAEIPLNMAQKNALKALQKAPEATKLLHGVTGSGKTNIYLKMAENAQKQQKSTILLVPEIALTSQLVRVFQQYFGQNVILIHSKQTEAERHAIFNYLLESDTPKVVIGPRSALFAPLHNLGLIIIDEEHETTYYQENSPKYSAVRIASFMAKTKKVPLVLGSATPTVEDYYLAKKRGSLVELNEKALATDPPNIRITKVGGNKSHYFSDELLNSISNNLKHGYQTLIFHNRRGSAPLTICESCGEEILCPNCFLPLTLHADKYELVCHTCGYHEKVPTSCPKCGHPDILHKGFGTKLLETELKKLFKTARIARFDGDNKKSETLDAVFDQVRDGEIDILIGTQTLAKGLDLPKLATVGVVQADAGMSLPDYAAEERNFELLTQVIGRVGRGHLGKAEVIIQTFRPDNEIISYAVKNDYEKAARYLLGKRKKANFPPYAFVAKLEITLKTESLVIKKVRNVVEKLKKESKIMVSPPMPAFHERTSRGYTWQIIVRAKSRKYLTEALGKIDKNFKITLDPPSLL